MTDSGAAAVVVAETQSQPCGEADVEEESLVAAAAEDWPAYEQV